MKIIEVYNGQQFEAHKTNGSDPCRLCCFKRTCQCPLDAPIKCMAHERADRTSVYFVQKKNL